MENSITSLQCSHQRGPANFVKSVGAVECRQRGCFCWSLWWSALLHGALLEYLKICCLWVVPSTIETSRSHKDSCLGNTEDVPILPNATFVASQTWLLPHDNKHCHARWIVPQEMWMFVPHIWTQVLFEEMLVVCYIDILACRYSMTNDDTFAVVHHYQHNLHPTGFISHFFWTWWSLVAPFIGLPL
jgi:hypothetical protein